MAVGAIEPQFFAQLLAGLGLSAEDVPNQLDSSAFPELHKLFADKFAGKTRDEWTEIFAGTDACVTPVLTWREAAQSEHLRARSTLLTATVSTRPHRRRGSPVRRPDPSVRRRKPRRRSMKSTGGTELAVESAARGLRVS
jgi:alpha-methylacyl-CoA racemase